MAMVKKDMSILKRNKNECYRTFWRQRKRRLELSINFVSEYQEHHSKHRSLIHQRALHVGKTPWKRKQIFLFKNIIILSKKKCKDLSDYQYIPLLWESTGKYYGSNSWVNQKSVGVVEWNGLFHSFRMMCAWEEKSVLCREILYFT